MRNNFKETEEREVYSETLKLIASVDGIGLDLIMAIFQLIYRPTKAHFCYSAKEK